MCYPSFVLRQKFRYVPFPQNDIVFEIFRFALKYFEVDILYVVRGAEEGCSPTAIRKLSPHGYILLRRSSLIEQKKKKSVMYVYFSFDTKMHIPNYSLDQDLLLAV